MAAIDDMRPQQLLAGCRNVQTDGSHEKFCLELFRRAIVEKSQGCWAALYEQYVKLVYKWIMNYAKTHSNVGASSIEDLVQDAFTAFWRSYSPEHFTKASSLGSVLKYLQSCAWSSVQHAVRKVDLQRDEPELSRAKAAIYLAESKSPEQTVLSNLGAEQLWRTIESCCKDTSEQRIARLRFVDGLKPKEIVALDPDLAQTENEIYKILRNIKDRIGRTLHS